MQVSLANKEKYSMLFLGEGLNFTYDEPGPIAVDLPSLSTEQRTQLYFNWKRGVLAVDNEEELKSAVAAQAPVPASCFAHPLPVSPQAIPTSIDEALKARESKLKALLKEKIDIIKKEIPGLSAVELRALLAIEKKTKKRQKLMSLINDFITKRFQTVSNAVGTQDVGQSIFNPNAQTLDNSLDVVESDMEEVTLIPSDKEL